MTQYLAPLLNDQQVDSNGEPLSGGSVEVYLAGSSTPAPTTSDKAGNTANAWPIVLNTLGVNAQGPVWVGGGQAYKFVIKDADGAVQRTVDNVAGINDASSAPDQWMLYQGSPTYVNASTFTLPGDQTEAFAFGRRVRTSNTSGQVYGTVVRSSYSTDTTTVVLATDEGIPLDSGLNQVYLASLTPSDSSIPATAILAPYRNRIINGGFRIFQRYSGSPITITAGDPIAYTLDRFYVACAGADVSVSQVTAGTDYRLTITGSTGNTSTTMGQRIESGNCTDWVNKQVYCQITPRSTASVTVTWRAYTADASDDFSTKTQIGTGTFVANGARAYFNFPAGLNASNGVAIEFSTGGIANGETVSFSQFQAEADQVTTFEFRPPALELWLCQRYASRFVSRVWRSSSDGNYAGSLTPLIFPATMRVAPALTALSVLGGTSYAIYLDALSGREGDCYYQGSGPSVGAWTTWLIGAEAEL